MLKLKCIVDEMGKLTPEVVKTIMDKDNTGSYILLDVRQPQEYNERHIPGAMLVPLGKLEARQNEIDRNKKVIIYCRSGHRSLAAAITLCDLGFERIYHIEGGILNWPYETISGSHEVEPDLITESATVHDVFVLGMKLEKGLYNFYKTAMKKTGVRKLKNLLGILANAEEGHIQRLYRRATDTLGKDSLAPFEQLTGELEGDYMEGGIKVHPALETQEIKFKDKHEILELALEKEYLSYDFYKKAAALVNNANVKTLLHELALEERNHADILIRQLEQQFR
ncbi:MAG: rhodanese-like domain-containing protein [Dehalococcoidia bacterium]